MIKYVYTMYDDVANFYATPFFELSDLLAMRSLAQLVNDKRPDNIVASCPKNFALFCIGQYDDETGIITPADGNVLVCGAADLIHKE